MSRYSHAFALACLLGGFALAPAGASLAATGHDHGHEHGAQSLQLNEGKRWSTDAPLRQAMGAVNESMRRALPAIHENRLPEARYGQLAEEVRGQVAYMVENCNLPADADAQLHLVIARMLEGADGMSGDAGHRRQGAVTVLGALQDYASYFDDPQFSPIRH